MSSVTFEIVFLFLLILANGVFAMCEIALISARKTRLQQQAAAGNRGARIALEIANAPGHFLSTVQIGITLVGILAGAFGGATLAENIAASVKRVPLLAPYSEAAGIGVVVSAITYLSLVFGELVPKRLALRQPERIAMAAAQPMRLLAKITSPVVQFLTFSTEMVLRALGVGPSQNAPITEEEVKIMIEQGTRAGVFEQAERDIVERVFRLGDQRISALLTPRTDVVWLDLNDPSQEIIRKITSGFSRFPVGQDSLDKVLGIVRAKDLLAQYLANQSIDLKASLRHPLFVPESMRALKILDLFKQSGAHVALVVDEYGGVQGLVTHHDILEAIGGDILPETSPTEQPAIKQEDGSWLIDGMLTIAEFKEILELARLPGEEQGGYDTVGGFALQQMGRIPSAGDHFETAGLRLEVVDMDGRRIDKLLVIPVRANRTK